jgi:hypothetical protein
MGIKNLSDSGPRKGAQGGVGRAREECVDVAMVWIVIHDMMASEDAHDL